MGARGEIGVRKKHGIGEDRDYSKKKNQDYSEDRSVRLGSGIQSVFLM